MDEAKEETAEDQPRRRTDDKQEEIRKRHYTRQYSSHSKTRKCIVKSCKEDHPPWRCERFKQLTVQQRKQLISKTKRCFSCLVSGHMSGNCKNARQCNVDGCTSKLHNRYLHEKSVDPQLPEQSYAGDIHRPRANQDDTTETTDSQTHSNSVIKDKIMVLPAIIENENSRKQLKVNVMLDPCSTSSYVTQSAAHELNLCGLFCGFQSFAISIQSASKTETTRPATQKRRHCWTK